MLCKNNRRTRKLYLFKDALHRNNNEACSLDVNNASVVFWADNHSMK